MRSNNSKIGQMTVKGCFMRSNNSKMMFYGANSFITAIHKQ